MKRVKIPRPLSKGEESLAQQLRIEGIKFERQVEAIPNRKFAYDFRITGTNILIEVQGGLGMKKGGHNSWSGIHRDMEKGNLATEHGYRLFHYSTEQVESGMAIAHLLGVL